MPMTISAENLTAGVLVLDQLNHTLPVSATPVLLTDSETTGEILNDSELFALIAAGSARLWVNGAPLSTTQAQALGDTGSTTGVPDGVYIVSKAYGVSTHTDDDTWATQVSIGRPAAVVLPAGEYELRVSYHWNRDDTSYDFLARIKQNGSVITDFEHQQEPKDKDGSFGSTGTNQKYPKSYTLPLTLTAGSYSWDLEFTTNKDNKKSSMWNASLILERKA